MDQQKAEASAAADVASISSARGSDRSRRTNSLTTSRTTGMSWGS